MDVFRTHVPNEWPDPNAPMIWDWSGPMDEPPGQVYIFRPDGSVEILPAEEYRPPE